MNILFDLDIYFLKIHTSYACIVASFAISKDPDQKRHGFSVIFIQMSSLEESSTNMFLCFYSPWEYKNNKYEMSYIFIDFSSKLSFKYMMIEPKASRKLCVFYLYTFVKFGIFATWMQWHLIQFVRRLT